MEDKELSWDRILRIRTSGRDDTDADTFNYPYEPTPYAVLERLSQEGLIRKGDLLLDYGAGKGRVDFFLADQTRCRALGIEFNPRIFQTAEMNREKAVSGRRVSFVKQDAGDYIVPSEALHAYFFNPFSVEILCKVLKRLKDSIYENPRQLFLYFYYPSDEYVSCLCRDTELDFYDEIDCRDLFPGDDQRERIMIFTLG